MLSGEFQVETPGGIIALNLAKFFNNGIPDIKDVLPYHKWGDLNTLERWYSSPLIWSGQYQGHKTIDLRDLVITYYKARGSGETSLPNLVGYFNSEGYVILTHSLPYVENPVPVALPDDYELTDDGGIYVDSQGFVCMTSAAYTLLNDYFSNAAHSTEAALFLLEWASQGWNNFSLDYPIGIRMSNSRIKFPFKFEFIDDDDGIPDIVWLTDANGNRLSEGAGPVFPDLTFGGLLPYGISYQPVITKIARRR
jgi:hypothetical protein